MRVLSGKSAAAYVRKVELRSSWLDEIEPAVRRIVQDVRRNGDRALLKYATKFDGLSAKQALQVTDSELRMAWKRAPAVLRKALQVAEKNIRRFCEWQKPKSWMRTRGGISLGQAVRPLESVGCYVPGGRHPLLAMPNVFITPHIGGATAETLGRGAQRAISAVAELLAGRVPANVVNPQVLRAVQGSAAG